jgi:hypothetical protein
MKSSFPLWVVGLLKKQKNNLEEIILNFINKKIDNEQELSEFFI